MKKSLIKQLTLLFSVACISSVSGQDIVKPAKQKRTELGIDLYTMDIRDRYQLTSRYGERPVSFLLSGIYLKRQINRNVFRTTINYYQRTINSFSPIPYLSSYYVNIDPKSMITGTEKTVAARFGYQWMLCSARLCPYFSADLGYAYSVKEMESWWPYPAEPLRASIAPVNPYHKEVYHLAGLGNGVGMRWQIKNCLVLNLETQLRYFYYVNKDAVTSRTFYSGFGMGIQPFILSMGFSF